MPKYVHHLLFIKIIVQKQCAENPIRQKRSGEGGDSKPYININVDSRFCDKSDLHTCLLVN